MAVIVEPTAAPRRVGFGSGVIGSFKTDAGTPLFIEPASPRHSALSAFLDVLRSQQPAIDAALIDHGAIVFRGFAVDGAAAFDQVAALFSPFDQGYAGGATPRQAILGRVFEASRVPKEIYINLHQEMAYLPRAPGKLAFFCCKPADEGGETLIGDMRRFTALAPRALSARIAAAGIEYRRHFRSPRAPADDPRADPFFSHRTWAQAFYTDSRDEVDGLCAARGLTTAWSTDDELLATNRQAGFVIHPVTHEKVWFNHIATQIAHPLWIGSEWERYRHVYPAVERRPNHVRLADGSEVSDADYREIMRLLREVTVSWPWQAGDILLIDNVLTAHGRHPYEGTRDVQVALID